MYYVIESVAIALCARVWMRMRRDDWFVDWEHVERDVEGRKKGEGGGGIAISRAHKAK